MRKLAGFIAVLACFCALVSLGLWQLHRLEWKEDLLAKLQAGTTAPAAIWSDGDRLPEFTHVKLTGGGLERHAPLLLYGRTVDGAAGAHLIALYRTDAGKPVIVDCGFIPSPIDPMRLDLPGAATVDGIVRAPSDKAWFELPNKPEVNQWYWMDLPAMARALGAGDVAPLYVEALSPIAATGAPLPTGDRLASNLPNNHLQYAITWFSLASALALMYAIWLARSIGQANKRRQAAVDHVYEHFHNQHPHYHEGHAHDAHDKHFRDPPHKPDDHKPHGAHLGDIFPYSKP